MEKGSHRTASANGTPAGSIHLVPIRFVWSYGGQQVRLTGSFDNWQQTILMTFQNGSGRITSPTSGSALPSSIVAGAHHGIHHFPVVTSDQPSYLDTSSSVHRSDEREEDDDADVHVAIVWLPPGHRWSFKFVVDGVWRCSLQYPTIFDEHGNVNNYVDSSASQGTLSPLHSSTATSSTINLQNSNKIRQSGV